MSQPARESGHGDATALGVASAATHTDETTTHAPDSSLHVEESGQVTIIVVFGALAFILLVALIYNTAAQTSRKIQMQGAADAAAVSAGVWTARGMNLMVLNNNTMVEMLSIMITARAIVQTCEIMVNVAWQVGTELVIAGAIFPPLEPIGDMLLEVDRPFFEGLLELYEPVDDFLSESPGVGWTVLSTLDRFNQLIKEFFPALPVLNANRYAELNGADRFPPGGLPPNGLLFPGKAKYLTLPIFPVSRGPKEVLLDQAEKCPLAAGGKLREFARTLVAPLCVSFFCVPLTQYLSRIHIDERIDRNIEVLREGNSVYDLLDHLTYGMGDIIGDLLARRGITIPKLIRPLLNLGGTVYIFAPPMKRNLQWRGEPRPMVLSGTPENDTTESSGARPREVFKNLELLAVALGRLDAASPLAGERYRNRSLYPWITYAQADVYNPTQWDMFTQDWRAKLVRAHLIDEKCRDIEQLTGLPACGLNGWSFVNTH